MLHRAMTLTVATVVGAATISSATETTATETTATETTIDQWPTPESVQLIQQLPTAFTTPDYRTLNAPGTDRVSSVRGSAMATGIDPTGSALNFITNYSNKIWNVAPDTLRPLASERRRTVQPLMFDPDTGAHTFDLVTFEQWIDGVKVHNSELRVLTRRDTRHPVVLARASLHDLDGFRVTSLMRQKVVEHDVLIQAATNAVGQMDHWSDPTLTVFAGTNKTEPARLAYVLEGRYGTPADAPAFGRYELIIDAISGEVIHLNDLLLRGRNVSGLVRGRVSVGPLPASMNGELVVGLRYAKVDALEGLDSVFSSIGGFFTITAATTDQLFSEISGPYFTVENALGTPSKLTSPASAGFVQFVHNSDATEYDSAQVDAYFHANAVRDWALLVEPTFPGLMHSEMPITVNTADYCNAFYSSGEELVFARAGAGCENSAYSTVVYHEYGHHIAWAAGGIQGGQYGEGFADCIAMLFLGDPRFALGLEGNPDEPIRSAEDLIAYPCEGIHDCAPLLSGAIWEIRNGMIDTLGTSVGPQELAKLMLASVFLNTDSEIGPQLAIDLLTLDDDDDDIDNGTPNRDAIVDGFQSRAIPTPQLAPVGFFFEEPRTDYLDPNGGGLLTVRLEGLTTTLTNGFGLLEVTTDTTARTVPLLARSSDTYLAVFPQMPCGENVTYQFVAVTTDMLLIRSKPYQAIAAIDAPFDFDDTFETDQGWTVTNDDDLIDGAWERGIPVNSVREGDPDFDADGSGQAYLTRNGLNDDDVDGGPTTLTSPRLDASGGNVTLSYYRWFFGQNNFGFTAPDDVMDVEYSIDDGATWILLERVGPEGTDEWPQSWVYREYDLDEMLDEGTDQFRIRFIVADTGTPSVVEAGVDAVTLTSYPCGGPPDCPCDFEGDGLGFEDVLRYLEVWFALDSAAELDGNPGIGILDLLEYLTCWYAGCPDA